MKVICTDGKNTKLIEGQIYEALDICGKNVSPMRKNSNYAYEHILLANGDSYHNLSRFSTLNGKTLDEIDLVYESDKEDLTIKKSTISKGDLIGSWVYCVKDSGSKYFIKDNYYKVEDVEVHYHWYYELKIEGYDRYYTANRFRLLSKKQRREIKIDIINGIEVVTTNFDRKFDILSPDEKANVIITKLYNAKKEISKNNFKNISIEDYIIECDNIYDINMEDIEEFKKLQIADLFKS